MNPLMGDQINQDRCGVIRINSSTWMLFTVMGKPIAQITNNKYLGVVFNDKWNSFSALKLNLGYRRKTTHSIYYSQSSNDIPTAI
ncbi:hypothetical protein AYI69_g8308 [Smittium culicis]|uniref:Uncharacterized protein n=1 Tax=Smittium culicis TaxID=133412 RepID=A0A1R1XKG0_9FUNG|nr:hypothetical protein AYI69_g8308 [Smittium culicis]